MSYISTFIKVLSYQFVFGLGKKAKSMIIKTLWLKKQLKPKKLKSRYNLLSAETSMNTAIKIIY